MTDGPGDLRHSYRMRIYTHEGLLMTRNRSAGKDHELTFDRLPAGRWWYRAERFYAGGGVRYVGWDQPIDIAEGEEKQVEVDCLWPWEK